MLMTMAVVTAERRATPMKVLRGGSGDCGNQCGVGSQGNLTDRPLWARRGAELPAPLFVVASRSDL